MPGTKEDEVGETGRGQTVGDVQTLPGQQEITEGFEAKSQMTRSPPQKGHSDRCLGKDTKPTKMKTGWGLPGCYTGLGEGTVETELT